MSILVENHFFYFDVSFNYLSIRHFAAILWYVVHYYLLLL